MISLTPMRRVLVASVLACALLVGLSSAANAAFGGWAVVPSPNPGVYGNIFNSVAAVGPGDVWAVGGSAAATSNRTLAAHWNGSAWTAVSTPDPVAECQDGNIQWTGNRLNAVAGRSSGDVWAVGTSCYDEKTLVERWNGSAWSIVPSPSFNTGPDSVVNVLNGVAVLSASKAWAVGMHTAASGAYVTLVERWNGRRWKVVPSPNPDTTVNELTAVAATGRADVWAVGYQGTWSGKPLIEHWDGASWSVVAAPVLPSGGALTAVTAISPTDAWAVGRQTGSSGAVLTLVLHWDGAAWQIVPSPNMSTEYSASNVLRGVTAISSGDVWAVGMFENESTAYHQHRVLTMHWDGSVWSTVSGPTPGASGELQAVTSEASGRVWGVGLYSNYEINIYDGTYTDPQTLVLSG
jgi:hypothetical protein